VLSEAVLNMPSGLERSRKVRMELIEKKREEVEAGLIETSTAMDTLERSLRQEDPEIEQLYRELEEKQAAYRKALEQREAYAAVQKTLTEAREEHRRWTEQAKALKKEMDHE
jgi:ssDNA-specific exonuclease RecJ